MHQTQCVQTCLRSLKSEEICTANLIDKFQILATLLTFLKETSHVSQILLDDFKACSGYKIIIDFALRLEKETSDEARNALKTLFFVLEEFIAAGFNELRPSGANLGVNMFKIEGFQVPEPIGKGRTVSVINFYTLFVI